MGGKRSFGPKPARDGEIGPHLDSSGGGILTGRKRVSEGKWYCVGLPLDWDLKSPSRTPSLCLHSLPISLHYAAAAT